MKIQPIKPEELYTGFDYRFAIEEGGDGRPPGFVLFDNSILYHDLQLSNNKTSFASQVKYNFIEHHLNSFEYLTYRNPPRETKDVHIKSIVPYHEGEIQLTEGINEIYLSYGVNAPPGKGRMYRFLDSGNSPDVILYVEDLEQNYHYNIDTKSAFNWLVSIRCRN